MTIITETELQQDAAVPQPLGLLNRFKNAGKTHVDKISKEDFVEAVAYLIKSLPFGDDLTGCDQVRSFYTNRGTAPADIMDTYAQYMVSCKTPEYAYTFALRHDRKILELRAKRSGGVLEFDSATIVEPERIYDVFMDQATDRYNNDPTLLIMKSLQGFAKVRLARVEEEYKKIITPQKGFLTLTDELIDWYSGCKQMTP